MNPSRIEEDLIGRQKAASIEAPAVLPEPAKEMWRNGFDEGYQGRCKAKKQNDAREACSAAYAWSVVKESYRKNESGEWVERTFEDANPQIGSVPLPDELRKSPVSVAMIWAGAYSERFLISKAAGDAAKYAWDRLRQLCDRDASGVWAKKSVGDDINAPVSEEAAETEMVEGPVIARSRDAGLTYRSEGGTPVVLDDIKVEDFGAVIKRFGREWAARPSYWPWEDWAYLPYERKTVAEVLRHVLECRAYRQAIQREKMQGWTVEDHPSGNGEVVFRGWVNVGAPSQFYGSAVLYCPAGRGTSADDWVLGMPKPSPLTGRAVPGMRRFRGPMIYG